MRTLPLFVLFAAFALGAENLLPNGSFDEGKTEALHWEKVDNLTSFWRTDGARGRILELDTRPERTQVLEYQKKRKENPATPPPAPVIPSDPLKSVGAYEGAALDSVLLDVKPGKDYKLSVDYLGRGTPFVWIKGFMIHPRRKTLTDCYQTRLAPAGSPSGKWRTAAITFRPTRNTVKMKVRIYAYWPAGVYRFDNVRLEEITPAEAAELRKKRSETDEPPEK